jgi:hypothetical protein
MSAPALIHADANPTRRQTDYLVALERRVPREAADAVYLRIVGVHRIHRAPVYRYATAITRAQASELIESYKRCIAIGKATA